MAKMEQTKGTAACFAGKGLPFAFVFLTKNRIASRSYRNRWFDSTHKVTKHAFSAKEVPLKVLIESNVHGPKPQQR